MDFYDLDEEARRIDPLMNPENRQPQPEVELRECEEDSVKFNITLGKDDGRNLNKIPEFKSAEGTMAQHYNIAKPPN